MASIVLLPGLARSLADVGSVEGTERRQIFRSPPLVAAASFWPPAALAEPDKKIESAYPVRAVDYAGSSWLSATATVW